MFVQIPDDVTFYVLFSPAGTPVDFWLEDDPDLPGPVCSDCATEKQTSDARCPHAPKKKTMSFAVDFVRRTLLVDRSFGTDMDAVVVAQELRGYFAGKRPGEWVDLPKLALDKLLGAMRKPEGGYAPLVMSALTTFFSALENAKEKRPDLPSAAPKTHALTAKRKR